MGQERTSGTEQYRARRDFDRTPEPVPEGSGSDQGPLMFVVHKHAARRLHFDFRLEVDGVLKSWAVPSGPSRDPKVKRLAVMVEDHPLEYGSFEGVIPPGEYGAGSVIVWDRGTYFPEEKGELFSEDRDEAEERMRRGLAEGKLSFYLRGSRLKGSWTLVQMRTRGEANWLLIKHHDDFARAGEDAPYENTSVVSGMDTNDLKAKGSSNPKHVGLGEMKGVRQAAFPGTVAPMRATLVETPPSGPGWAIEPKLDGYRTLACIRQGKVKLLSRRGLDTTGDYPHVVEHLHQQPVSQMVLDGEMVALDEEGVPDFQLLQRSAGLAATGSEEVSAAIVYYVFDILYLDGYDLTGVQLQERREILEEVLAPTERVRLVEQFTGDPRAVFDSFRHFGLEGIIVKKQDSVYESGRRSRKWTKLKSTLSEDFVVGGFTHGLGTRAHTFGALLLGYHDDTGHLRYAGSVGSGFDDCTLAGLRKRLDTLIEPQPPFGRVPPVPGDKTWVRPEIVVEVKYNQWTRAGYLRAPVFLRVRDDKQASEVRFETPSSPVSAARFF